MREENYLNKINFVSHRHRERTSFSMAIGIGFSLRFRAGIQFLRPQIMLDQNLIALSALSFLVVA